MQDLRAFIKTPNIVRNYAFTKYLLSEIETQGVGQSQIYLSSSHKAHSYEPFLTLNEKRYLKRMAFDIISLTKKIDHFNLSNSKINEFKIVLQHRIFLDLRCIDIETEFTIL